MPSRALPRRGCRRSVAEWVGEVDGRDRGVRVVGSRLVRKVPTLPWRQPPSVARSPNTGACVLGFQGDHTAQSSPTPAAPGTATHLGTITTADGDVPSRIESPITGTAGLRAVISTVS